MDYQQRLKNLQKQLQSKQIDFLIVDDPTNLYYMTGLKLSLGRLCVSDKQEPLLLVDGRYIEACKTHSPFPVRLTQEGIVLEHLQALGARRIGFDSSRTTYQSYLDLQKLLEPHANLIPIDDPFLELRQIKDKEEIYILKKAAALAAEGFDFAASILREGITEREVAIELEIFWKRKGGERLSFDPIIAFGANSSMPHYRPAAVKLKKGDTVLIDIGVTKDSYCSDMTRTLFFGQPPAEMAKIYEIVREAHKRAMNVCRPGILIGEVDKTARDYITSQGYGNLFSHGLGHGVGLDIHEAPILKQIPAFQHNPLEKGMAITIEPGIYISCLGGVRIENTLIITDDGFEDLTLRSTDMRIV
jgi:Xaa-Pro aminopeptidase